MSGSITPRGARPPHAARRREPRAGRARRAALAADDRAAADGGRQGRRRRPAGHSPLRAGRARVRAHQPRGVDHGRDARRQLENTAPAQPPSAAPSHATCGCWTSRRPPVAQSCWKSPSASSPWPSADGLRRLAAKARAGASTGASIEDRILRVDRTEAAVPAADLVTDLYRRMPDARITRPLLRGGRRHPIHRGLHAPADRVALPRPLSVCSTCCSPRGSTSACVAVDECPPGGRPSPPRAPRPCRAR